jgi:hypothetical protein
LGKWFSEGWKRRVLKKMSERRFGKGKKKERKLGKKRAVYILFSREKKRVFLKKKNLKKGKVVPSEDQVIQGPYG